MGFKDINLEFENNDVCVSWRGVSFRAGEEFSYFLQNQVRNRLDDVEETEDLRIHLRGLELTGMGSESLEAVLSSTVPENRDWAAGEALAEAYLIRTEKFIFPWNMNRDKRNPSASLPGVDLVGFISDNTGYQLALGEVKTSSERASPPKVMSGRHPGMAHQIDKLASDMTAICQIISWLRSRIMGGEFQAAFESSCLRYFNSGNKSVALFGVLVRDTQPDERDLSGRGNELRQKLVSPTRCNLVALYIPCPIDQLVVEIRSGGDS